MSRVIWALAGVWSLVAILPAQSANLHFFACGTVAFFGEPCPPETQTVAVAAAHAEPSLFAPETVARDMPPLLMDVLQSPTQAHARRFVTWYLTRLRRIQEVRDLIRSVAETPALTSALSVSPLSAQRR